MAAAEEVKVIEGMQDDGYCHTSVSVDGTWQWGGFSSLNGAVAAISMVNGKVLDVAAMTRHCQGRINLNALESSLTNIEFMKRKAEHDCSITHVGSAPAMEMKGTGVSVVKYECIGHVQKRVGNRLRNLDNLQTNNYYVVIFQFLSFLSCFFYFVF